MCFLESLVLEVWRREKLMALAVIWSVTCAPVMAQGEMGGLWKDTKMQNVYNNSLKKSVLDLFHKERADKNMPNKDV